MTATAPRTSVLPGGSFMIGPVEPGSVFTPEQLSDEHRAIRAAVTAFVEKEVAPRRDAVEGRDYATHRALLERLGQRRLSSASTCRRRTAARASTASAASWSARRSPPPASFAVTHAAHTGIGTLPVVFFGTDAQKRRYLPGLADGTRVGAYCLTEPAAGSDAMGIRTRATRVPDGRWRLDGTKQFITNAGFADLFTVYAKIDGEAFCAFLVERDTPGLIDRRRGGEDGHARRLDLLGHAGWGGHRRGRAARARRARAIASPSTS